MSGRAPPAGDFLARMARASRRRMESALANVPEARLVERARRLPAPPGLHLSPQGFDVIAELKRRSPSAGSLAGGALQIARQARDYVRGGACALSVLTEPTEFDGHLDHLKEVAAVSGPIPAMRKDFLVAPYQVYEARVAGAGGVLLIVAMLNDAELRSLLDSTLALGMFALIEIFDATDLERVIRLARRSGPAVQDGRCRYLVGVNCRDLRTLKVDFARFAELAGRLPGSIPRVAESGVESVGQSARVAELGYDVALVGTALMRAPDPGVVLGQLLAAGRASRPR